MYGQRHPRDDQLTHLYKRCCSENDLSLIPPPFGLKDTVPMEGQVQFVVITHDDGSCTIFNHFLFPQKINAAIFKNLVYGTPQKASFMSHDPKLVRTIIQYCPERMGGRLFKCYELSSQGMPFKVMAAPFEEKDDEAIDEGFDYIHFKFLPRSGVEMQQLRWTTKRDPRVGREGSSQSFD